VTAIYGLYADPQSAQAGWDGLRTAGVGPGSITVISSEPFEEYEFSHRESKTWLFWIAAGGGIAGALAGYWLTSMTQMSWPLPTGGMPIVAMWPNLIVMFEMTMLGAVLATVAGLLVAAGIPARHTKLYDRAVSEGAILVGVERPADASITALERALRQTGASDVKTIP
jgi:ActD protein